MRTLAGVAATFFTKAKTFNISRLRATMFPKKTPPSPALDKKGSSPRAIPFLLRASRTTAFSSSMSKSFSR